MIPDEEIRKLYKAEATEKGVTITIKEIPYELTAYEAFRFSTFLDRAIMDACAISGKKVDSDFAR